MGRAIRIRLVRVVALHSAKIDGGPGLFCDAGQADGQTVCKGFATRDSIKRRPIVILANRS